MLIGPRPNLTIETTYQCHDCGWSSVLVTHWNAAEGSYEILCGTCQRNDLEPRKSLTQLWREDPGSVPIHIANRFADKYRKDIEAVAEGLPDELAKVIREKYLGRE